MNSMAGWIDGWRLLLLVHSLLCLMTIAACSPATEVASTVRKTADTAPVSGTDLRPAAELSEKWGIEITMLSMTAAGHMVDFRFRVLDPEKAASLFAPENKPYLIDQASEKVLAVPKSSKVGPLRTSEPPMQDRIYWMFFGTVPGLVKTGSKVTVVIGDFRAEDLVVQ